MSSTVSAAASCLRAVPENARRPVQCIRSVRIDLSEFMAMIGGGDGEDGDDAVGGVGNQRLHSVIIRV